jgi:cytosine/adenosine deaminase-related metal-dependent hydrolase
MFGAVLVTPGTKMPLKSHPRRTRRIAMWALAITVLLFALALALVKSHMHRLYGGYVAHADTTPFVTSPETLAITNVSVLSADGETMLPDRTVLVAAGRIAAISGDTAIPAGTRAIDAHGKYLIPGLIDAHVHLRKQPNDLLLYLANGVTHVRDLAGSPDDLVWRAQIEAGRPGPRLTVASPQLFTAPRVRGWIQELIGFRQNVGSADRAERVVGALAAAGYDAVKTYSDIDVETFDAVQKAAAELGLHTVGHLPYGIPLDALATMEMRELAHIEEIVKVLRREFREQGRGDFSEEFPDYASQRADAIIDDLLANDIAVNSTLWLMENMGSQVFRLEEALSALPLAYANPAMLEGSPYTKEFGWLPGHNKFESVGETSPEERRRIEAAWEAGAEAHRRLARRMAERGVRVTAGTDATSHLAIPGFSLHDELDALVRNGMTPTQALRAATATPAEVMSSDDGVIAVGRRADLLLLSANPLDDIGHTRMIDAVVRNGALYDRARLDDMLDAVMQANAESRRFDLSRFR